MSGPQEFQIRRDDLHQTRFVPCADATAALADGEARLRIERYAFTANNVTYAVFGEAMAYWQFFPAPDGWGRIPVWGFAEVVESTHPELPVGERLFGYLPMATHLRIRPGRLSAASLIDAMLHRAKLPAAYQQYSRVAADPRHTKDGEDHQALLWPLYMTSFLIADFLIDNALFGAAQLVLSSASSKTALGLAFLLAQARPNHCRIIGLTSSGNRDFCVEAGYYNEVRAYDEIKALPADTPTVFVDMAGNGQLLHDLHHHFGEALRYSCMVGSTHFEARQTQHGLPGAKPTFFFAPTQIEKRRKDWGPGGIDQRFGEAWAGFLPTVQRWMQIQHGRGAEAIAAVYRDTLNNRVPPQVGHILLP